MVLDHLILHVNDVEESSCFYTEILGMINEGKREPFMVIRVSSRFTIQLAPWGTKGGTHLAFAMPRAEFEEVIPKDQRSGIEFGDSSHSAGSMKDLGKEVGARGPHDSLYFFDPNKHPIEVRHYE